MINIYTKNNIDAKPYIKPSSSGNYDGTIAWDIEVVNVPVTYSMAYQGSGNINWGDASNEDVSSATLVTKNHTYNTTGIHTIIITGDITRFRAGTNTTSKNLVRTIHSMSLDGYLGNDTSYSNGEFANCKYATISDNFTFADSILYLEGSFYYCTGMATVPPTFTLPPNVENLTNTFRSCAGHIVMPSTFNIPNSATKVTGLFRGAHRIKFTNNLIIPTSITNIAYMFCDNKMPELAKVVLHSGISNFTYAFAETDTGAQPIWPASFSSATINVSYMFYHYSVNARWEFLTGGTLPAALFWLDTSKTWLKENAFHNAKQYANYSSIPSS